MKNKTRFGLAGILGAGVLAGSLGLGGCAEMGPEFNRDMALVGIALGGAAQLEGIDQGDLELYTAGQNLQNLGQYSGNVASSGEISEAIRERRDGVNVYVGDRVQQTSQRSQRSPEEVRRVQKIVPLAFALKDYLDKENDPKKRAEACRRESVLSDYLEKENDEEKIKEAIKKYCQENPHIKEEIIKVYQGGGNPYYTDIR